MQLQVGEVGEPDQRGEVVTEDEVDVAVAGLDRLRADPLGRVRRLLLLVEVLAVYAVGVALEGQRAAAQMREHRGRDARVVVHHLALGEAGLRVEDLVEVRQRQPPAVDVDLCC